MSLKPGLGSHARQWKNSWRLFAVHDGAKIPVPRYLHKAWRDTATPEQLHELQLEREKYLHNRDNTQPRLDAAEQIALAKQRRRAEARTL